MAAARRNSKNASSSSSSSSSPCPVAADPKALHKEISRLRRMARSDNLRKPEYLAQVDELLVALENLKISGPTTTTTSTPSPTPRNTSPLHAQAATRDSSAPAWLPALGCIAGDFNGDASSATAFSTSATSSPPAICDDPPCPPIDNCVSLPLLPSCNFDACDAPRIREHSCDDGAANNTNTIPGGLDPSIRTSLRKDKPDSVCGDCSPAYADVFIDLSRCAIRDSRRRGREKPSRKEKREANKEIRARKRAQEQLGLCGKNPGNSASIENALFKKRLSELGLYIHQTEADGDCLFHAIAHQLELIEHKQQGLVAIDLRSLAADYIFSHCDDFIPFMISEKTHDQLTEDEFKIYCKAIRSCGNVWGGESEINALACALAVQILVYQTNATEPLVFGEENGKYPPLRLSYHQHQYGLGAHYNSLATVSGELLYTSKKASYENESTCEE